MASILDIWTPFQPFLFSSMCINGRSQKLFFANILSSHIESFHFILVNSHLLGLCKNYFVSFYLVVAFCLRIYPHQECVKKGVFFRRQ